MPRLVRFRKCLWYPITSVRKINRVEFASGRRMRRKWTCCWHWVRLFISSRALKVFFLFSLDSLGSNVNSRWGSQGLVRFQSDTGGEDRGGKDGEKIGRQPGAAMGAIRPQCMFDLSEEDRDGRTEGGRKGREGGRLGGCILDVGTVLRQFQQGLHGALKPKLLSRGVPCLLGKGLPENPALLCHWLGVAYGKHVPKTCLQTWRWVSECSR